MRFVPCGEYSSVVGVLRDVFDELFPFHYLRLPGASLYCLPGYCVPIPLLPDLDDPFVGLGFVLRRRCLPHYFPMKW